MVVVIILDDAATEVEENGGKCRKKDTCNAVVEKKTSIFGMNGIWTGARVYCFQGAIFPHPLSGDYQEINQNTEE